MRYLIETARRYGLDAIVGQVIENENVHGIIVDLHPFWLWAYKIFLTSEEEIKRSSYWYYRYARDFGGEFPPGSDQAFFPAQVPIDLDWRPESWSYFMRKRSNLVVRIQLTPGAKPVPIELGEIALNVFQEHVPIPELASKKVLRPLEGGISIGHGSDAPGTLGGILKDNGGTHYALTCGHVIPTIGCVVDQPSLVDDSSSSRIGSCKYATSLKSSGGVLCNPRNSTVLNDLDLSLIEIDAGVSTGFSVLGVGKIDDYTRANMLHPGLAVEFNGRTSGHRNLVLGGIGLVHHFTGATPGTKYCFKDLIEVKFPSSTTLALKRPVKPGDSGAWLVSNGAAGLEWSGMIVGQNRQAGYAMYSEDILSHLHPTFGVLQCS